jgi:shikimate kinase
MGQPYDKRFARNQQKYLNFEKEAMQNIFKQMKDIKNKNIVIDTTGSFVHLDDKICRELKRKSLVIYIQATSSMQKKMFERYIKNPKPVVFGNTFNTKKGETGRESLERCYPKLLHKRSSLYAKYADVIIPCESIDMKINVKDFINIIKKKL